MSFDWLAPHYGWMEAFLAGHKLQRARIAWLAEVGAPQRALLVGEGIGRFLGVAVLALPTTRFVCVDASAGMLEMARRVVPYHELSRVEFEKRTMPRWAPDREGFDLVVTHFFLDCFPAGILERVVGGIADGMRRDAAWLIADFALPARGPARWRASAIHFVMYAFFRWATRLPASALVPPEPVLTKQGLVRTGFKEFEWGLIRSSIWRRE